MSDYVEEEVKVPHRFSDTALRELQESFTIHVDACQVRFEQSDIQFLQLLEAQKRDSDLIKLAISAQNNNTASITTLVDETRAIVQLYSDLGSATRIGKRVQGFFLWVFKWPLIATGAYSAWTWIKVHLL